jgi:hypothetical protein
MSPYQRGSEPIISVYFKIRDILSLYPKKKSTPLKHNIAKTKTATYAWSVSLCIKEKNDFIYV